MDGSETKFLLASKSLNEALWELSALWISWGSCFKTNTLYWRRNFSWSSECFDSPFFDCQHPNLFQVNGYF